MIRQFELVERVQSYDPDADEEMLNRAYVYGLKKHGTQLRASGDPYFSHPVEVAGILAEMRLDTSSIVTGLLHDTLEDTDATRDEIARLFGENVARLVDGVTKLSRLEVQSESTKEAENLRKLVLAMSSDIRVLLVKLADRLHNMRTLHHIKDRRGAGASRARPWTSTRRSPRASAWRRSSASSRSWPSPSSIPTAAPRCWRARATCASAASGWCPRSIAELIKTLKEGGLEAQVSGREKTPYSIWRKMQSKNVSFEQLSDIMAFRIIVADVAAVLPGAGHAPRPLPGAAAALQGLHLGAQAERLSLAAYRRDRPARPAHRDPDPHRGDAGPGRRGVAAHWIYKQGGRRDECPAIRLAARASWNPRQGARRRRSSSSTPSSRCSRTRCSASRPRASSSPCRAAPRRSTSPMPCTARSATPASAPRSTAACCRCARSSPTATRSRSSPRRRRRRRRPGSASSSPARPRPRSAASSAPASASSTSSSASRCSTRPSTRRATTVTDKGLDGVRANFKQAERPTISWPPSAPAWIGAREVLTAVYPGLKQPRKSGGADVVPISRARNKAAKAAEAAAARRRRARSPSAA